MATSGAELAIKGFGWTLDRDLARGLLTESRRAAAGRAELLANPAIRARIFAGSIQTPHGLLNLPNFNSF